MAASQGGLKAIGAGGGPALAAALLAGSPVELRPGQRPWAAFVRGTADGVIRGRVIVLLPGIDRRDGATLWLEAEGESTAAAVAIDERPAEWVALRGDRPSAVA